MKRTFVVVMSVVIVLACIRFGFLVKSENFSVIAPLKTGESYRILYEEKIPREKLSLFTVNEKLIVLFFDYEGIINIYSIDGEFLYGFQIESLKKGTGDIAFHNDRLFVKARGGRMYIFNGNVVHSSFRSTEDAATYREAERLLEGIPCSNVGDVSFHVVGNRIMKAVDGGPYQTLITLPMENPDIKSLGIFILLAIAGLMHYMRKT